MSAGAWVLLASGVYLLGCGLIFPPDEPEPVEAEGCTNDHTAGWAPDPEGAWIGFESVPADGDCNEFSWVSGARGQGADVFHFEPEFHFEERYEVQGNSEVLNWEIRRGGVVEIEGAREVYAEDVRRDDDGFYVAPEIFLQPEQRGKNFEVEMWMEVLDPDSEAGGSSSEPQETMELRARARIYII